MKYKTLIFKNFLIEKYLVLFIPVFFIISIFLLEVSLLVLTLLFFFYIIRNKEFKFLNNNFFKIFILFYLFIITRYLLRSEPYSDESIFFYFRYGLYALSIYYFLCKISNLDQKFFKVIKASFILLFIDSSLQFFTGKNILGFPLLDTGRVASFFGDEAILGSYILHCFPFILLSEIKSKNAKTIIFYTIISFLCILMSGERSSLGLFIILITFYLIIFNHQIGLKKISFIFLSLILSISILIIFSPQFKQRFITQTYTEMKDFNFGINREFEKENLRQKTIFNNMYIFSGYHNNLLLTALEFNKSNKLYGIGPRGFKNLCKELIYKNDNGNIRLKESKFNLNIHSCSSHPHNYYFQILAELGILGLLVIFSFYFFIIYKVLQSLVRRDSSNSSDHLLIIYGFFFINLWPITTSGDFFNNWISIIIYIPFAFYLYVLNNNITNLQKK